MSALPQPRTSFHHQPEAQHPNFQLPTSWQADYPIFGSWPCENFSGRATRRNISEQLHLWESNHTAHARFDALLESCVFYISRMYEFLHSQGHTRPFGD